NGLRSLTSFLSSTQAVHRDLHSFPTRRSSDLSTSSVMRLISCNVSSSVASVSWGRLGVVMARSTPARSTVSGVFSSWLASAVKRSEEHTSELQSRSDLVCRLLLEKKKEKADLL